MEALLGTRERVHVNGVDKQPYLSDDPYYFTRKALARAGGATVTHPWAGYMGFFDAPYGPKSTTATHWSEYLIQYMQAFSADPSRQVWIEEEGCSTQWVDEPLIPDWAETTYRTALSCDNLFAFTWWSSHNPSRDLTGFASQEYTFGLYDEHRRLTPTGPTRRSCSGRAQATRATSPRAGSRRSSRSSRSEPVGPPVTGNG